MDQNLKAFMYDSNETGFYAVPPEGGIPRAERRHNASRSPVSALSRRRTTSTSSLKRLERYMRIVNKSRSQTELKDRNELNALTAEENGLEKFKFLHATRGYKVRPV